MRVKNSWGPHSQGKFNPFVGYPSGTPPGSHNKDLRRISSWLLYGEGKITVKHVQNLLHLKKQKQTKKPYYQRDNCEAIFPLGKIIPPHSSPLQPSYLSFRVKNQSKGVRALRKQIVDVAAREVSREQGDEAIPLEKQQKHLQRPQSKD